MNYRFCKPDFHLSDRDKDEINSILDSGWVSIGENVERLERQFASIHGFKYAIAYSSATTGLTIAVKAAGWKNMRVALPAFTWPSTLYALESNQGNSPVFCDIHPKSWHVIPSGTFDAILAVDIFGSVCPSPDYDVPVIYDAAHSFGMTSIGDRPCVAAVISLSFTKPVSSMEGGMILTNQEDIVEEATELRRLSGRMGEINALVGIRSIERFAIRQETVSRIIDRYRSGFTFKFTTQSVTTCANQSVFSILFENPQIRNAVMTALAGIGIETKIYHDPLSRGLLNTEDVYSRILSLPIYKEIEEVQDQIIEVANKAAQQRTPGLSYIRRDR